MCGICGEIRFDGASASPERLSRMAACLERRGPDGAGQIVRGRMGLGHRRLKIIDLSEKAAQPMEDPELGLTIAFNGCIYNYPELRRELEAKGYRFFSSGDTEVILKAYHAWGRDCVKRFHGMFAFAIHERDTGRVMLARDRFGIKPLYLSQTDKRLYLGSSLQAILRTGDVDTSIDREALHHYMTFHAVVPPPLTIIRGVRKLPPATTRMIEPDGTFDDAVYWAPDFSARPGDEKLSSDDWRDLVMQALRTAVDRRMVADVPVGVLLSGGVDSSLIVGLLAEAGQKDLNTFSIGFEDANGEVGNEFEFSDLIAKHYGTKHHKIFVPGSELMEHLPGTIQAMSEPMVSYDNVGFYLLSREVSKHIKVVQSGQGADEIFGGYHWYPPMAGANDPLAAYSRAFFDRSHETLEGQIAPEWMTEEDVSREFRREPLRHARRREPGRQGAEDRRPRHAGRRSGQARRQHDHGLGAGGARAVPRPRAGRARRAGPCRGEAEAGGQGRTQGGRAAGGPVGGDRPQEGLFPGAAAEIHLRPLSRHGQGQAAV